MVFSDIHDNMDAVAALRRLEENMFDAIVVAGDIGS
jgi:predicted phosphodiesterase